jgi:AAA ATPase domain
MLVRIALYRVLQKPFLDVLQLHPNIYAQFSYLPNALCFFTIMHMNEIQNPFHPGFGVAPTVFVGRQDIVQRVDRALANPNGGDPYLKVVARAHRGTGKTVLLDELGDSALSKGWVVVTTEAGSTDTSLTSRILIEIQRAIESNNPNPRRRLSNVSLSLPVIGGGFGVDLKQENGLQASNLLETCRRFFAYGASLPVAPSGLFLSIDEIHDADPLDLRTIGNTLQLLERQGHSIALAMAGLPDPNQTAGPTFLARCQHLHLAALTATEVADGLRETAATAGKTWTDEAIIEAIGACSGYPYMMQLVGYQSFDTAASNEITVEDVREGVAAALVQLSESVLAGLPRQLSTIEQRFLYAMAVDEEVKPTRIADVAKRTGQDGSHVNVYRDRLIKAGLIVPLGRGLIGFAIPGHRTQLRTTDGYLQFIDSLP